VLLARNFASGADVLLEQVLRVLGVHVDTGGVVPLLAATLTLNHQRVIVSLSANAVDLAVIGLRAGFFIGRYRRGCGTLLDHF
jgi:predicted cobalt transporter CbtA